VDDEDRTPRRTWLAAERTFLAWWRTGLATAVSAVAVGRALPELVDGPRWPYAALGVGYAVLAVAVFLLGARRHRDIDADLRGRPFEPLSARVVSALTAAGAGLALATIVLVVIG
jgi:putative membrane protein